MGDRARTDMLASSEAVRYAGSRTGPDLEKDRMRLLAIVRLLEVVGEAANGISEPLRQEHPELPWRRMKQRATSSFTATETSTWPWGPPKFGGPLLATFPTGCCEGVDCRREPGKEHPPAARCSTPLAPSGSMPGPRSSGIRMPWPTPAPPPPWASPEEAACAAGSPEKHRT